MDRRTHYLYASGRIDDIRKGRLDNLTITDFLSEPSISSQSQNKIIIPKFVGVYQQWEVVAHTPFERENIEQITRQMQMREELILRTIKSQFKGDKREERFHKNLIHIGYDTAFYQRGLVKEMFGGGAERIKISPYSELPNFPMKNRSDIDLSMDRLAECVTQIDDEEKKEEIRKAAQEGYSIFQDRLCHFGLTSWEYAFFVMLDSYRTPAGERKIIIPESDDFLTQLLKGLSPEEKEEYGL